MRALVDRGVHHRDLDHGLCPQARATPARRRREQLTTTFEAKTAVRQLDADRSASW